MPLPLLIPLLLAAAGGATAVGSSMASRRRDEDARDYDREQSTLSREERALDREMEERQMALQASQLNPFRSQMNQARSVGLLDAMENSSYAPTQLTPQGAYGHTAPSMSGGFSFQPSADAGRSAGALKRSVMAGQVPPLGSSGALDLVALLAGQDDEDGDPWTIPPMPHEEPRGRRAIPRVDKDLGYTRGY